MNILAINGTYRPEGTTTQLTRRALQGAESEGATTEMVLLTEHNIKFCTNCLGCYQDLESDIASCSIDDDVRGILEKIRDADGIILSSPVHSGFITALMNAFMERATWTLNKPTGTILGLKGCPEPRLTDKVRASASIMSAGGIPTELREYCDMGTPFLKDMAELSFNGELVVDMYAGAVFPRELTDEERTRAYFIRELADFQLAEAFDLGVRLAQAIRSGKVRPYDPERFMESLPEMPTTGGAEPEWVVPGSEPKE